MNLLENYLVEIIKIEPCNETWIKDNEHIWVTATFNCYGSKTTTRRIYSINEWDRIVERGYYFG